MTLGPTEQKLKDCLHKLIFLALYESFTKYIALFKIQSESEILLYHRFKRKKKKNPWEPFVLPALLVTPCRIQFFTYCNQNHIYLPVIQI